MTERVIRIVFDTSAADRNADRFGQKMGQVERKSKGVQSALTAVKIAAAAAFAAQTIRIATTYGDTMTRLQNRLKLVTTSSEQLAQVQGALFTVAQRTATPVGELAELYSRTAQATQDLGVSQGELLTIVEAVSNAARISGSTQAESAGAIRQFTQALAGGTLRAEEFNSIIEGTPRLANALADAFGVAAGDLRKLVNDGKITSEQIVGALLDQADVLKNEFATATLTAEDETTKLSNAAVFAFNTFDKGAGITRTVSSTINDLTSFLTDNESMLERLGEAALVTFSLLGNGVTVVQTLGTAFIGLGTIAGAAAAGGLDAAADAARGVQTELSNLLDGLQTVGTITKSIDQLRENRQKADDARGKRTVPEVGDGAAGRGNFTFRPGAGRSGGRGGGGRSAAQQSADFVAQLQREAEEAGKTRQEVTRLKLERLGASESLIASAQAHVEHIEQVEALKKAEAEALQIAEQRKRTRERNIAADERQIQTIKEQITLLQLTTTEQERYIAQLNLSVDATDEQRRAVDDLVVALQDQRDKTEQAQDEMRRSEQFADDFAGTITDGLERAIVSGENFGDTLKNIALELAKLILRYQVLEPLQRSIAGGFSSGDSGGGGFFGSLFSAFTSGGGGAAATGLGLPPPLPTGGGFFGPFATGGSFVVPGGGGGVDRERVVLDATAGERVTVEPVGSGARVPVVNINIENNGPPAQAQVTRAELDGETDIRVVIGTVIEDLDRSGARDQSNAANFGSRRRGVNR